MSTGPQAGGSFLPNEPARISSSTAWQFDTAPVLGTDGSGTFVTTTGTQTLTNKTLTAPTITAPAISGAATVATGATLTGPAITAPVISGAATVASGATLTTPTIAVTALNLIATGATGASGAAISSVYPAVVYANGTGVSGAGLDLATGAAVAGAWYTVINGMTGVLKIYAVGGTINGTTGTTAFSLSATGNLTATVMCVAAGAWRIAGNT